MNTEIKHPYSSAPNRGHEIPPFKAEPSGGENDLWFVANGHGFNCLTFLNAPGAKFTCEEKAKEIAASFNTAASTGKLPNP